MYSRMAKYYDKLYSFKDYKAETEAVINILNPFLEHGHKSLLDVACGTGMHLMYLKEHFSCHGMDICPELLLIAKDRNPDLNFTQADMTDFDLHESYDVITCFFGSIGHVLTRSNMQRTLMNFTKHLKPNGVMLIEPWHSPEEYRVGNVNLLTVDEPDLKIARVCTSLAKDGISILDMHHGVATPQGSEHFLEHLELGMWTDDEFRESFAHLGFDVRIDRIRDRGRKLFLAYRN